MARGRRRRGRERDVAVRALAVIARALLVGLVAVAVGYAFYATHRRVADLAAP